MMQTPKLNFFVLFLLLLLLQLLSSLFVYEFCNSIVSRSDYIPSNGRIVVNNVLEGMWKEVRLVCAVCNFFSHCISAFASSQCCFGYSQEAGRCKYSAPRKKEDQSAIQIILNVNSFTVVHHSVPPDSVFWRFGSVFVIWYEGSHSFGPMQRMNITHWNSNSEFGLYFVNMVNICW